MKGSKYTPYEEKERMGTLNKTRDKKPPDPDPEIAEYLNKIKIMLDMLWKKLNDKNISDIEMEKYSRLFIMWQKHFFTYRSLIPKKQTQSSSVLAELINEKEN
jgi:hypothetical protein